MKNIVLAAALALIAVPALAVGPESFTVDVSRGYAVQAPGAAANQEQGAKSNWAPRGQAAQQGSTEEGSAPAPASRKQRATKASGKPHHRAPHAPGQGHAPSAPAMAPAPAMHPAK